MSDMLSKVGDTYSILRKELTWSSVLVYGVIFGFSWVFYKLLLAARLSPLRKIPGRPVKNIFIGNLGEIFSAECIDLYVRWVKEMGTGVIRYRHIFGSERLLIADADAMKHIMVTHSRNYPKPTFLFKLFVKVTGGGLINLNGEEHMTQRKLCLGAFKSSFLRNMIPAIQRHSEGLVDLWSRQVREDAGVELDVETDLGRMTMDTISDCGFGYDTGAMKNPEQPECKAFVYLLGGMRPSILRVFWPSLADLIPSEQNRLFTKNKAISDNLIQNVIKHKAKVMKDCKDEDKYSDLLSMLMLARDTESGEGLSSQQLADHVMTFMLAGHETTATTMTWCLLKLSQNPEIKKQVQEEVKAVLPPKGQQITFEHLEELKYLTCVIKETLRLYPAAPMTFRTNLHDDTINGHFIPAGTVFNIQVGTLHRNPAYWEDPEEFRPERFEDESKILPYTYLPFVAGPRMCIGYKFALMEMKITLAILLRELDFSLPNPDQYYKKKQRITMKPEPSLKLKSSVLKS